MAKEETKKKTTTKKTTTTKKAAPKKPAAKKTTTKTTTKKAPVKKATTTKKTVAKKAPVLVQEKNQYGKMTIALVLIALVLIACYCGYQIKSGNWNVGQTKITESEKKFKTEFETLNGTANSDGITHITVTIPEDNNVEYITLKDADKMLDASENKSGIILFGYAANPWGRNLIPLLLEVANEKELDKIYYVNLMNEDGIDLRTTYTLDEKTGKLNMVQGENEYYNVRASLSDYISDYVYYNAKDKKTTMKGEKYLSAPTVVAIKEGKILDVYESTIETTEKDSGATKVFTTEDKNKAKEAFGALIDAYLAEEEATEEVEDKE